MRALIAGCGYVGTALAVRLAGAGHQVFAVRRRESEVAAGVHLIRADLSHPATSSTLPDAIDAVFYTAAPDDSSERAYRATYVEGLRNVLAALTKPARFLLTTSTAVYAQDAGEWVDESSPTKPERFQGQVLLESEALAQASGLTAIAVRFGGIYGSTRTRLIDEVMRGAATIPDRPSYTNRIHRDDCAGVLAHLAVLAEPAGVYVGVDDDPADRRDVIRWLANRLGAPPPAVEPLPGSAEHGKRCRNAKLRATGYRFSYPSFRDGYAEMVAATGSKIAGTR